MLRHRHFRNVFIAAFVSNIGNWMELLGVQMIVAHVTGSLKMLGYLGAAHLMPVLVLGLLGGVVADRVNRKMLLVVTQAMLMLVAGGVAIVSWLPMSDSARIGWLLALVVTNGTITAFNVPAWQVLTPRLVPKAELVRAITANGVQFNLARVIGPALAGIFLGSYGPTPLFILNTLTFIGVLLAISSTPNAPAPPPSPASWGEQMAEAARFSLLRRGPVAILCAMILMSTLAAPLIRMLPLYVIDVYGIGEQPTKVERAEIGGPPRLPAVATPQEGPGTPAGAKPSTTDLTSGSGAKTNAPADRATGLLIAVLGVGAVSGGFMLRLIPSWYPKHHFIPMAIAGAGLTITLFALTTALWSGLVVIFFCGIFWIWAFNQSWAAMQNVVPDAMRGRVMSIANVAAFGANAVGNVASGWLGDALAVPLGREMGTHLAVGVLSGLLLLAGLVMMANRVPEIDGMVRKPMPRGMRRGLINAVLASEHRPPRKPRPAPESIEHPGDTGHAL